MHQFEIMKRFALENPFISGVIIFVIIFLIGSLAGIVLGMQVMTSQPCQPGTSSDPCDGAAMAAGIILIMAFAASFIFGLMTAASTYIVLSKFKDRNSKDALSIYR